MIEHNYRALQDLRKVLLVDGWRDCIKIVWIGLNGMDAKEDNAQEYICKLDGETILSVSDVQ